MIKTMLISVILLISSALHSQLRWDYSKEETKILSLINSDRLFLGLKPLAYSDSLCFVSSAHCADLVVNNRPSCPLTWSKYGEWTHGDPCVDGIQIVTSKPRELVHWDREGYEIAMYTDGDIRYAYSRMLQDKAFFAMMFYRDMKYVGVCVYEGVISIWFSK